MGTLSARIYRLLKASRQSPPGHVEFLTPFLRPAGIGSA